MKAKEYAANMIVDEQEQEGLAIARLLIALITETNTLITARKCTTMKALKSVIKETEKKYRAIQKRVPQFWDSSESFKNSTFVQMVEVLHPKVGSAYTEAVTYKNKEF